MANLVPIADQLPKNISGALVHLRAGGSYIRTSVTPKFAQLTQVANTFEEEVKNAGKALAENTVRTVRTKLPNVSQTGLPLMGQLAEELSTAAIICSIGGCARMFGYIKKPNPSSHIYGGRF